MGKCNAEYQLYNYVVFSMLLIHCANNVNVTHLYVVIGLIYNICVQLIIVN